MDNPMAPQLPMPSPDEALSFLDSVVSTVHATRLDHVKMQQSLAVLASVVREHATLLEAMHKDAVPCVPQASEAQQVPTPPPSTGAPASSGKTKKPQHH